MKMPSMARTTNPTSSSCRRDENQDRQEVHDHKADDDLNDYEDEESPSVGDKEKEGNKVETIILGIYGPAEENSHLTIKDLVQMIFLIMLFSQMVVEKLKEDQG